MSTKTEAALAPPPYLGLRNELRELIRKGKLQPGDRFFSEHELISRYQLSRMTVRRALKCLESEGFLRAEQGRRRVVTSAKVKKNSQALMGFSEDIRRRGMRPHSKLLRLELIVPPVKLAQALSLEEGEKIFRIIRVRFADNAPLAFEISHIPHRFCEDLTRYDLEEGSLYALLEQHYGIHLSYSEEQIRALPARKDISKYLRIPPRFPVLEMKRRVFSDLDCPVELGISLFRGDRYTMCVRSTRVRPHPPV